MVGRNLLAFSGLFLIFAVQVTPLFFAFGQAASNLAQLNGTIA